MLSKVSEKTMHQVRSLLAITWLILIASLFYDPITHHLTDPNNTLSPFRESIQCVLVQGNCLDIQQVYPIGTRIFWGMVVPSAIMLVFVLGHETWRRICPLYFFSQITRALGWQPRLKIEKNPWLIRNHLYLQFALLFIGLNFRILFINSARAVLGTFLLVTILSAITVVFLYGGRSWCHYVCPFGVVQTVLTGPRGLLGSEAHKTPSNITQSMCRTLDKNNGEKSACIACKSACLDIDSESAYWQELTKPGRKLIQYGYLGLVIGYFVYYYLYAGNFDYYYSGDWSHETNQLSSVFQPGFYIYNHYIYIPKIVAAPLTTGFSVWFSCLICTKLEKAYKANLRRRNLKFTHQQVLHKVFSLCTFLAFNSFFIYGARPEILRLPTVLQLIFNALVILLSSLWLYRTWNRSEEQYKRESQVENLRRQLQELGVNFSRFLNDRSLEELNPDELYILAKTLPNATQLSYKAVLQKALTSGNIHASTNLELLQQMREELGINEKKHYKILTELGVETPELLDLNLQRNREQIFRIETYQKKLDLLLLELVESGISLQKALEIKSKQILAFKQEYQINPEEDAQILAKMFAQNSDLWRKSEALLTELQVLGHQQQNLKKSVPNPEANVFVLLRYLLGEKQQFVTVQLLSILEIVGEQPDALQLARRTGIMAKNVLFEILSNEQSLWEQRLSPKIMDVLTLSRNQVSKTNVQRLAEDETFVGTQTVCVEMAIEVLLELLKDLNPLTQAASLYGIYKLNAQKGIEQARLILSQENLDELVRDTAEDILQYGKVLGTLNQILRLFESGTFKSVNSDALIALARSGKVRT
ncbi:4Fe-4S binding protein [Floridanema aerugineum]|uniref:4Fe-4S binding protein n=1 Tax=Floridaenema aerugineum BLCC-F46 TaxID=3153654 RepID=A0ABV4X776_9CYAN